MKPRTFSPLKLDLAAFAEAGASLEGAWTAVELERLADAGAPETPASGWPDLSWRLQAEMRRPKAGPAQTWLRLEARANVWLTCQRCLQPLSEVVQVDRWLRFVEGESQAAALDADSDDDVLALPRHLDARELIEDELLLALPLVPRHAVCPEPLPVTSDDPAEPAASEDAEREHPFAKLAALKRSGGGEGGGS